MPISAISPDLALRLYPVRSSEIMNITDTPEWFLYKHRYEIGVYF